MQRQVVVYIFVLTFMAFTNVGVAQQERADDKKQEVTKVVYTCPMHPDVKSDKPGDCPKCGMGLVLDEKKQDSQANDENKSTPARQMTEPKKLTPAEKIKTAKKLLQEAKSELTRSGEYNCCIEDPCNQCALDHQSCPCYDDLKKGKPVCPECYGGWQRGEGRDKKVKPADVKTQFSGHKH